MLRAADDFYPDEPSSQPVHLANVAYNSLFLGEVGHTDWDMFQSSHPDAALHAAARSVGGCPIYVSDKPGTHDANLLRQLVLPDGTALVANQPGRPTRDILFTDVNADGETALKVWNMNDVTGVLGLFNVQGARWDRATRKFVDAEFDVPVTATIRPSDIEGWGTVGHRADGEAAPASADGAAPPVATEEASDSRRFAVYTRREATCRVLSASDVSTIRLAEREWELATVSPVSTAGAVHWAPLGLSEMLNGGGAIVSSSLTAAGLGRAATAATELRAAGDFVAYASPAPAAVKLDGVRVPHTYDAESGLLRVSMPREARRVELSVAF